MITRNQLTEKKKFQPYPVGVYTWSIENAEYVNKDGNERLKLFLKFVGGSQDGKPLTTSFFFDTKLGDLITIGLGKKIDDVFGTSDKIDPDKLCNAIKGGFFTGRLGIKNDYNNITEILEEKI